MLFQKKEGELENAWSLGKIDQLVRGRDGMVRRVIIQYQNASLMIIFIIIYAFIGYGKKT